MFIVASNLQDEITKHLSCKWKIPNWWTAVKKPSKKKAVLGYLHTRFSYYLREKKNSTSSASSRPQFLLQIESIFLFRHLGQLWVESSRSYWGRWSLRWENILSNLILGMDGFGLEACQYLVRSVAPHWMFLYYDIWYSKSVMFYCFAHSGPTSTLRYVCY